MITKRDKCYTNNKLKRNINKTNIIKLNPHLNLNNILINNVDEYNNIYYSYE